MLGFKYTFWVGRIVVTLADFVRCIDCLVITALRKVAAILVLNLNAVLRVCLRTLYHEGYGLSLVLKLDCIALLFICVSNKPYQSRTFLLLLHIRFDRLMPRRR
jgi:hypothetical protein